MVSNASSTRAWLSLILMVNLCILVFWLSGFDPTSYISHLVYGHIKPYFPRGSSANSISLIEVKLNLGSEVFKAQMKELPQQLSQYVFFKYFIIITKSFLDWTDLLLLYIPMQLQKKSSGFNQNQMYAHSNLRM